MARASLPLLKGLAFCVLTATACGNSAITTDGAVSPADAAIAILDMARTPDLAATLMHVSLQFKAKVGTKDFACGQTYSGLGTTNATVKAQDFRFYVQDVRLVNAAGVDVPVALDARAPWQTPDVALLDFENGTAGCANGNPQLNDIITGTVPADTYTGVVFSNGVPEKLDHADPVSAPAPLQAGDMTWGWLYGYKFIKIELASTAAPAGDGGVTGIGLFHLGSVDCNNPLDDAGMPNYNQPPSVACGQQNRNQVRLTGYHLGASVIVLDAAQIFAHSDLSADTECHSDDPTPCDPMFAGVGLKFKDGSLMASQTAYHLE